VTSVSASATRQLVVRRVFAVLGLAMIAVLARAALPNSIVGPVYATTVVATVLAALPLVWARDSDPFEPLAYSSFYLIYGNLGILGALLTSDEMALPHLPLGGHQRASLAISAITLNLMAFGAYAAGYWIRRRRIGEVRPPSSEFARPWSLPRLTIITTFCVIVFLATYGIFQSRLGLPLLSIDTLREGKRVWRDDPTTSWMLRGVQIIFVPIALWAAYSFRHGRRWATTAVLGVAIFAAFLLTRMGQRSIGIYPLIAILGVFHYLRRRVGWSALIVGMMVVVEFTNLSSSVRSGEVQHFGDAFVASDRTPLESLGAHELERGRLDSTATILFFFPDRVDYLLGESWKPLLVLFVPRWLDPDKTRGHEWSDSQLLQTLVGFPAPAPFPALLYANFGYLGVALMMALYGYGHASLYAWLRERPGDESRTILYMLTLIFFTPTSSGFASALQYVVPAFLTLRFIERSTSSTTPTSLGFQLPAQAPGDALR